LLLPTPQLPNAVTLSASIAAVVAITHLFDTAIKQGWHGQWQRKQWLRGQGWRVNDGNNGNGDSKKMRDGNKTRDGDSNDVAGDKGGDGKNDNSNDKLNKEGNVDGGKGNGNGV
jgi:hypothetical protein